MFKRKNRQQQQQEQGQRRQFNPPRKKTKLVKNPLLAHFSEPILEQITNNFPYLYTLLRYTNYENIMLMTANDAYKILTSEYRKDHLADIIIFMDKKYPKQTLMKLTIKELFLLLTNTIQQRCTLSNFLLQDLFAPESVFKVKYRHDKFVDVFITAFYYILNCTFEKSNTPFQYKNEGSEFKFPMDVDPKEFDKPCILIDVANQFFWVSDTANKNQIQSGRKALTSREKYKIRFQHLKKNIRKILEQLFSIHDETDMLVIFINQGSFEMGYNCPEIYSVTRWNLGLDDLLRGSGTRRLHRKVLYISVPCHLFLYPELRYATPSRIVRRNYYFNEGSRGEPSYPQRYGYPLLGYYQATDYMKPPHPYLEYRQQVDNILYDKYGRMLYLPDPGNMDRGRTNHDLHFRPFNNKYTLATNLQNHIPYYKYVAIDNDRDDPNYRNHVYTPHKPVTPHTKRHTNEPKVYQGKNANQRFVNKQNECSGHSIYKNEIDDYMMAILLFIHKQIHYECKTYCPYRPKWLVFSHDKYDWMNKTIKQNVEFQQNFQDYLTNPTRKVISLYEKNPNGLSILEKIGLNSYEYDENSLDTFRAILRDIENGNA